MKRFIQGEHRGQSTLLPESLDDCISDTNPVRVVDELELANLGFDGVIPAETGRPCVPPCDPAEDLYLRLSELHPIEPEALARSPAQCGADVATGLGAEGEQFYSTRAGDSLTSDAEVRTGRRSWCRCRSGCCRS